MVRSEGAGRVGEEGRRGCSSPHLWVQVDAA